MRRLAAALALAAVFVAAILVVVLGRTGTEQASGPLDDALGYFPRDAALVVAVQTDADAPQGREFARLLERLPVAGLIPARRLLGRLELPPLDFEDALRPLLGDPLVVGLEQAGGRAGGSLVVAIHVDQPAKAKQIVLHGGRFLPGRPAHGRRIFVDRAGDRLAVAVDGSVLVAARSRDLVARALGNRRSAGRMRARDFERDLAGLPRDALLRASADPRALIAAAPGLRGALRVRWIAALRRAAATLRIAPDGLALRLRLRTDPGSVRDADLPLEPRRGERIALIGRSRELAIGVRRPARLLRFILDVYRAIAPRRAARFDAVARRLRGNGIDLERDLVDRLGGSAALVVDPVTHSWAARVAVPGPASFKQVLARLADSLPDLAAALGVPGLGVATPDTGAAFYALARPTGKSVVFGVVGPALVAASEPRRAAALASERTRFASGARGALVATIDARKLALRLIAPRLPAIAGLGASLAVESLGDLTAAVSIDRAGLDARAKLTLE